MKAELIFAARQRYSAIHAAVILHRSAIPEQDHNKLFCFLTADRDHDLSTAKRHGQRLEHCTGPEENLLKRAPDEGKSEEGFAQEGPIVVSACEGNAPIFLLTRCFKVEPVSFEVFTLNKQTLQL